MERNVTDTSPLLQRNLFDNIEVCSIVHDVIWNSLLSLTTQYPDHRVGK